MKTYVVQCQITGDYILSTNSRKANLKDLNLAKRYSLSGAKTAANWYQSLFDSHYNTDQVLYARDPVAWQKERDRWHTHIPDPTPNRFLRRFEVVDLEEALEMERQNQQRLNNSNE
jgi:hypothetical protein